MEGATIRTFFRTEKAHQIFFPLEKKTLEMSSAGKDFFSGGKEFSSAGKEFFSARETEKIFSLEPACLYVTRSNEVTSKPQKGKKHMMCAPLSQRFFSARNAQPPKAGLSANTLFLRCFQKIAATAWMF